MICSAAKEIEDCTEVYNEKKEKKELSEKHTKKIKKGAEEKDKEDMKEKKKGNQMEHEQEKEKEKEKEYLRNTTYSRSYPPSKQNKNESDFENSITTEVSSSERQEKETNKEVEEKCNLPKKNLQNNLSNAHSIYSVAFHFSNIETNANEESKLTNKKRKQQLFNIWNPLQKSRKFDLYGERTQEHLQDRRQECLQKQNMSQDNAKKNESSKEVNENMEKEKKKEHRDTSTTVTSSFSSSSSSSSSFSSPTTTTTATATTTIVINKNLEEPGECTQNQNKLIYYERKELKEEEEEETEKKEKETNEIINKNFLSQKKKYERTNMYDTMNESDNKNKTICCKIVSEKKNCCSKQLAADEIEEINKTAVEQESEGDKKKSEHIGLFSHSEVKEPFQNFNNNNNNNGEVKTYMKKPEIKKVNIENKENGERTKEGNEIEEWSQHTLYKYNNLKDTEHYLCFKIFFDFFLLPQLMNKQNNLTNIYLSSDKRICINNERDSENFKRYFYSHYNLNRNFNYSNNFYEHRLDQHMFLNRRESICEIDKEKEIESGKENKNCSIFNAKSAFNCWSITGNVNSNSIYPGKVKVEAVRIFKNENPFSFVDCDQYIKSTGCNKSVQSEDKKYEKNRHTKNEKKSSRKKTTKIEKCKKILGNIGKSKLVHPFHSNRNRNSNNNNKNNACSNSLCLISTESTESFNVAEKNVSKDISQNDRKVDEGDQTGGEEKGLDKVKGEGGKADSKYRVISFEKNDECEECNPNVDIYIEGYRNKNENKSDDKIGIVLKNECNIEIEKREKCCKVENVNKINCSLIEAETRKNENNFKKDKSNFSICDNCGFENMVATNSNTNTNNSSYYNNNNHSKELHKFKGNNSSDVLENNGNNDHNSNSNNNSNSNSIDSNNINDNHCEDCDIKDSSGNENNTDSNSIDSRVNNSFALSLFACSNNYLKAWEIYFANLLNFSTPADVENHKWNCRHFNDTFSRYARYNFCNFFPFLQHTHKIGNNICEDTYPQNCKNNCNIYLAQTNHNKDFDFFNKINSTEKRFCDNSNSNANANANNNNFLQNNYNLINSLNIKNNIMENYMLHLFHLSSRNKTFFHFPNNDKGNYQETRENRCEHISIASKRYYNNYDDNNGIRNIINNTNSLNCIHNQPHFNFFVDENKNYTSESPYYRQKIYDCDFLSNHNYNIYLKKHLMNTDIKKYQDWYSHLQKSYFCNNINFLNRTQKTNFVENSTCRDSRFFNIDSHLGLVPPFNYFNCNSFNSLKNRFNLNSRFNFSSTHSFSNRYNFNNRYNFCNRFNLRNRYNLGNRYNFHRSNNDGSLNIKIVNGEVSYNKNCYNEKPTVESNDNISGLSSGLVLNDEILNSNNIDNNNLNEKKIEYHNGFSSRNKSSFFFNSTNDLYNNYWDNINDNFLFLKKMNHMKMTESEKGKNNMISYRHLYNLSYPNYTKNNHPENDSFDKKQDKMKLHKENKSESPILKKSRYAFSFGNIDNVLYFINEILIAQENEDPEDPEDPEGSKNEKEKKEPNEESKLSEINEADKTKAKTKTRGKETETLLNLLQTFRNSSNPEIKEMLIKNIIEEIENNDFVKQMLKKNSTKKKYCHANSESKRMCTVCKASETSQWRYAFSLFRVCNKCFMKLRARSSKGNKGRKKRMDVVRKKRRTGNSEEGIKESLK